MKTIWTYLKSWGFLLCLLALFVAIDILLPPLFDHYTVSSGNFYLNDDEITHRDHPEEVWDKVFFGNSAVISGYREDLSDSGYINYGLDYGMVRDLAAILRSDEVTIGSELVLGLNWAAMFDNMETNPDYFWHRGPLEPYVYFQRDRLSAVVSGRLRAFLTGQPWADGSFAGQQKAVYYASLSQSALEAKAAHYAQAYWSTGIEGCAENLAALYEVADLCTQQDIRLRVVLMPWNPSIDMPEVITQLNEEILSICRELELETLDLTHTFGADCFHDLGHMNYEYGAYQLMEVIDPWLAS